MHDSFSRMSDRLSRMRDVVYLFTLALLIEATICCVNGLLVQSKLAEPERHAKFIKTHSLCFYFIAGLRAKTFITKHTLKSCDPCRCMTVKTCAIISFIH